MTSDDFLARYVTFSGALSMIAVIVSLTRFRGLYAALIGLVVFLLMINSLFLVRLWIRIKKRKENEEDDNSD